MTAYERMLAKRQISLNVRRTDRNDTERDPLAINSSNRLSINEQMSAVNLVHINLQNPSPSLKTQDNKVLLKSNSVKFIQRDIDLPSRQPIQPIAEPIPKQPSIREKTPVLLTTIPRKSVAFEDYNPIEQNPLGKRDGLEMRDDMMPLKQNIKYLLGTQRVATNKDSWRIVEIGQSIEQNIVTYSRLLLAFWVCLPQTLIQIEKMYWLLAIIVSFFVSTTKSSAWLLFVFVLSIVLEIGLRLAQVIGKFQNGKEIDRRKCKKLDIGTQSWREVSYDELTAGDIIKVEAECEFPCDCVIIYSSNSRLVNINQENLRGRYAPLILKQAILKNATTYEGMLYLRTDTDIDSMHLWVGKAQIGEQVYTLSYKNFCHRGSINYDSPEIICAVMYTTCNQKNVEAAQYPQIIKPRAIPKKFNDFMIFCSVVAFSTALLELVINIAFTYTLTTTSLKMNQKFVQVLIRYFCQFTILIPILAKPVYLLVCLILKSMVQKDAVFKNRTAIADSQSLPELGQTNAIVTSIKTLFYKSAPKLHSLRIKQINYHIGDDIEMMPIKDIEMVVDVISAAYLSCQELENTTEKQAILQSGSKFGISRDFSSNIVKLHEENDYFSGQLLKEHPKTDNRPFTMNFYRQSKTNRILCLVRGNSDYIISKLYSKQSQVSRMVRRIEQEELCSTEILGKTQVTFGQFQKFVEASEVGPLAKLNEMVLEILKNLELLGVLVYDNVYSLQMKDTIVKMKHAAITTVLIAQSANQKELFLKNAKLQYETLTVDSLQEQFNSCLDTMKEQIRILEGSTFQGCNQPKLIGYLCHIFKSYSIILLHNFNKQQTIALLEVLRQNNIVTTSLCVTESQLHLLKYCSVGVTIDQPQRPYIDKLRYCDAKVNSIRDFFKLIFVHGRNSYLCCSKMLSFFIEKSAMLFIIQLIFSFYSLCSGITLVRSIWHYVAECWLLGLLPFALFIFEGDFSYDIIMKNTKIFNQSIFTWTNLMKKLAVTTIQAAIIIFIVMSCLTEPIDSTGTIKSKQHASFIIFFCIFHVCLFKAFLSLSSWHWQQALILLGLVMAYYLTMIVFCHSSIASSVDFTQSMLLSDVFNGRGYLICAATTLVASLIDLMILLNNSVFSSSRLSKMAQKEQHQA